MRFLVGFNADAKQDDQANVFVLEGDKAFNISQLDSSIGNDLIGLMGRDDLASQVEIWKSQSDFVLSADITPALPIANPGKIICLGLNYIDHIKEGGYKVPEYPALFMRSNSSMMPSGAAMIRPQCSEQLDYEAEMMVIIGKSGKHISEVDALDHVFAYTTFNDGSVRDYQRKTHQWTPGKNFDSTGALGPISVTPEELPEGATGLKIESRVGSEILQSANTSEMLWSVAKVISEISVYSTLMPGDLIAMGTPPGVGHAKKPPRWLRAGETIEVEIEGIGLCASPIRDE